MLQGNYLNFGLAGAKGKRVRSAFTWGCGDATGSTNSFSFSEKLKSSDHRIIKINQKTTNNRALKDIPEIRRSHSSISFLNLNSLGAMEAHFSQFGTLQASYKQLYRQERNQISDFKMSL